MNLDKVLEFDKVKKRWKELAVTEFAHEEINEATYILYYKRARLSSCPTHTKIYKNPYHEIFVRT